MFVYLFMINPQPFGFEGIKSLLRRYTLSTLAAILLLGAMNIVPGIFDLLLAESRHVYTKSENLDREN